MDHPESSSFTGQQILTFHSPGNTGRLRHSVPLRFSLLVFFFYLSFPLPLLLLHSSLSHLWACESHTRCLHLVHLFFFFLAGARLSERNWWPLLFKVEEENVRSPPFWRLPLRIQEASGQSTTRKLSLPVIGFGWRLPVCNFLARHKSHRASVLCPVLRSHDRDTVRLNRLNTKTQTSACINKQKYTVRGARTQSILVYVYAYLWK